VGPFVDDQGYITPTWQLWLISPQFQALTTNVPVSTSSGGTGSTGGAIASSLNPILTGDVTSPGGTTATTLATVNASPGSFGNGTQVASYTVNGKGLVTTGANIPITGAPGSFTVVGAFGCNTKAAQTAYASGGAVANTGSTNVAPYGYTTSAQADGIVALLNNIRAALVANGIMS
jgi:hypothetical protein